MHLAFLKWPGSARRLLSYNRYYIGGANLIFTFLGMSIIDKVGRKTLLITGAIGTVIFLALTAFSFKALVQGISMSFFTWSALLLFLPCLRAP